jgi:hypothetical protein
VNYGAAATTRSANDVMPSVLSVALAWILPAREKGRESGNPGHP